MNGPCGKLAGCCGASLAQEGRRELAHSFDSRAAGSEPCHCIRCFYPPVQQSWDTVKCLVRMIVVLLFILNKNDYFALSCCLSSIISQSKKPTHVHLHLLEQGSVSRGGQVMASGAFWGPASALPPVRWYVCVVGCVLAAARAAVALGGERLCL